MGTLYGNAFWGRRDEWDQFEMYSLACGGAGLDQQTGACYSDGDYGHVILVTTFPSANRMSRGLWREYLPYLLRVFHASEECSIGERYDPHSE